MEQNLEVIIQVAFILFLFGMLTCAVGVIILMCMEFQTRKLERETAMAEYEYETDPRTLLRLQKEEEAFNDQFFDRIQEFRNGV